MLDISTGWYYFSHPQSSRNPRLSGLIKKNSTSNWTFIALNIPYLKGTLRRNKTKTVNQFQYPGTGNSPSTTENARGK